MTTRASYSAALIILLFGSACGDSSVTLSDSTKQEKDTFSEDEKTAAESCVDISSADDFQKIRQNPKGMYCLTQDIDFEDSLVVPLADRFTGSFDGRNHSLRNFEIILATSSLPGLFGELAEKAEISNLNLQNVELRIEEGKNGEAGILASSLLDEASLQNVHITGSRITHLGRGSLGGLVGGLRNSSKILNSSFEGSIVSRHQMSSGTIGGLVASVSDDAHIKDSVASSRISVTANSIQSVGGFVGLANSSIGIQNSIAAGYLSIRAKEAFVDPVVSGIGGFVGLSNGAPEIRSGTTMRIYIDSDANTKASDIGGYAGRMANHIGGSFAGAANLYSRSHIIFDGDFKSFENIGGFVGYSFQALDNLIYTDAISFDRSNGTPDDFSGFRGHFHFGTISNSFWNSSLNPELRRDLKPEFNATPIGGSQMYTASTFIDAGWDPSIWIMENGSYPELIGIPNYRLAANYKFEGALDGYFSDSSPYFYNLQVGEALNIEDGYKGKAIRFTGDHNIQTDRAVQVFEHDTASIFPRELTVCMAIRPNQEFGEMSQYVMLASNEKYQEKKGFYFGAFLDQLRPENKNRIGLRVGGSNEFSIDTVLPASKAKEWTHIAATYNGRGPFFMAIYIDGKLVAKKNVMSTSLEESDSVLKLGNNYDGDIDEVVIVRQAPKRAENELDLQNLCKLNHAE